MSNTLYVGNLPWNTTAEELNDFFGQYAPIVNSRIITNRETGRSRGFGFIEIEDEDTARLVEEMNGKELGGRLLTVNEAKPKSM
ncbi:MAG: RNA-binding protein [Peptococcaceae bacterium]|jgi:RNA recognition motif-containing protein|nr:RNA-binding protein [Peptococcaceae bacterium]